VSREKPHFPTKGTKVPVCIIELEDRDILKFVTGGLHGLKAFTENKIRIAGDITLAVQLEEVFRTTGGVEKAKEFLKNSGSSLLASKL
jgi:putative sterol carrier protein